MKTVTVPDERTQEAIDLVRETIDALYAERGDTAKLWGSMVKQTLKRRQPSFNEQFYGFGSFAAIDGLGVSPTGDSVEPDPLKNKHLRLAGGGHLVIDLGEPCGRRPGGADGHP